MKSIFKYFIDNSFVVNMVSIIIIVVGLLTLTSMNRDLMPQFKFNQVNVQVILPGASPEEMERFVTFPLEEALAGLPGVEKIESVSTNSETKIKLRYLAGQEDMNQAVTDVESRVNMVRSRLPQSVRDVYVKQERLDSLFLAWLSIENFNPLREEHRQFARRLEERMLDVEGIIYAKTSMPERHIHIQFIPEKLRRYEISIPQVYDLLRQNLQITPLGVRQTKSEDLSVEISRTTKSIEDIRRLPILSNLAGFDLRLKDIAQVEWKLQEEKEVAFLNGKRSVGVDVQKSFNHDTIDLKSKMDAVIGELNKEAPEGLRIVNVVDGPHFVKQQLDVLWNNGVFGLVLVIAVLLVFLHWKTALMTLIGVPIAYFGTAILLHLMGININLISLIGMIIVVGILVDDAIIVAESYEDRLLLGLSPREAALSTAQRLFLPVTATILTTVIAFAPMVFIKSEMSIFLFAVPVVIISALFWSWFETFFVLPNHLAEFVKVPALGKGDAVLQILKKRYERSLHALFRWRYAFAVACLAVLVGAGYIGLKKVSHDFNLNINSERVRVFMVLKESDSVETTIKKIQFIEDGLQALAGDQIENTAAYVGRVWRNGKLYEGPRYASFSAFINRDHKYPTSYKRGLQKKIEAYLATVDRSEFEHLYSEIQSQGGDEDKKQMVGVRIKGGEDLSFDQIEKVINDRVKNVKVIKEYARDEARFQKTWRFIPRSDNLTQYGIQPLELSRQIRSQLVPDEIIETRMGGEKVYVYGDHQRSGAEDLASLAHLEVVSRNGSAVPLRFLGEWAETASLKKIEHLNGDRQLTMDFRINPEVGNTAMAKDELQKVVKGLEKDFPHFDLSVIDSDEQEGKNAAWALKVAVVCIAGVMFIIAMLLNSLTQPLLVGLPIPFGLVGIVLALYFHNLPLGLMALIGLVGTVGVSVNSSIVMVDEINGRAQGLRGLLPRDIIVTGASARLRAILLTTLTTLVGAFPMAYSWGGESGFTQPLAFSMGWGILASTFTALYILPISLEIRNDALSLMYRCKDKYLRTGWGLLRRSFGRSPAKPPAEASPRGERHPLDL